MGGDCFWRCLGCGAALGGGIVRGDWYGRSRIPWRLLPSLTVSAVCSSCSLPGSWTLLLVDPAQSSLVSFSRQWPLLAVFPLRHAGLHFAALVVDHVSATMLRRWSTWRASDRHGDGLSAGFGSLATHRLWSCCCCTGCCSWSPCWRSALVAARERRQPEPRRACSWRSRTVAARGVAAGGGFSGDKPRHGAQTRGFVLDRLR